MKNKIKQRILESLSWSEETLNQLIFATPDTALHDPFLYTNMERLIDELHAFKLEQDKDPSKLLVVDPDYDTDGIMSAAVLTAALSLFNINHRVYIPSMQDGYGLSPKAVDDMLNTYNNVSLILTADNGTNAFDGIDYNIGEPYSRDTLIIEAGEEEGIYMATFDIEELRKYRSREVHGNAYRQPTKYKILLSEEKQEPFIRKDYRKSVN